MKTIFPGVFEKDGRLYVINTHPEYNPFNDYTFKENGKDYIEWNHTRSKWAAGIMKGLKEFPVKENSVILYLGGAHGYSCSKLACIATKGVIYSVEFSERCFKELLPVTKKYNNINAIFEDARFTDRYQIFEKVDIVMVDIADSELTNISILNCKEYLKKNGYLLLSVKSRSIDVIETPRKIVEKQINLLKEKGFEIVDWRMLDPFESDHGLILAKFI